MQLPLILLYIAARLHCTKSTPYLLLERPVPHDHQHLSQPKARALHLGFAGQPLYQACVCCCAQDV